MNIEQFLKDIERGYASGLIPRRRIFAERTGDGAMACCALTASRSGAEGRVDTVAIERWAEAHYGLSSDFIIGFLAGFDTAFDHPGSVANDMEYNGWVLGHQVALKYIPQS